MAFTTKQINEAEVINLMSWNRNGGWDTVASMRMTALDYIKSDGIYVIYLRIDGTDHRFYSKGAKAYGLEYLD